MRVLNLVTNHQATFYRNQVASLERLGVESTTIPVPGRHDASDNSDGRSPIDYLRFYPPVLRESFGRYDLLHANYGLTAPFALAQPNLPVVLTLWGSDLFGRFGAVSKVCARGCDAVVVMSEVMGRELATDYEVIPHGIDLETFKPESQTDAREALGWRPDAWHVLFPYRPSHPVKDYPRAKRIVERARSHLDGAVELQTVSGVPHERMSTYMNAADAFLMTSKHEGSPNAVKEALACNLPVVSTDVGDVRERVDDVELSFVGVDDDALVDALVYVLESERRSDGREHVRELSLGRMGERIVAVYESVIDG